MEKLFSPFPAKEAWGTIIAVNGDLRVVLVVSTVAAMLGFSVIAAAILFQRRVSIDLPIVLTRPELGLIMAATAFNFFGILAALMSPAFVIIAAGSRMTLAAIVIMAAIGCFRRWRAIGGRH